MRLRPRSPKPLPQQTIFGSGQVVFATLVDDPASVAELVDAYVGLIMLEAASAADVVDGEFVGFYTGTIAETATAADTLDGGVLDTSVKLLLGFEGANNSTGAPGMTDESQAARGTATVLSRQRSARLNSNSVHRR